MKIISIVKIGNTNLQSYTVKGLSMNLLSL
jgi:hypothetical protein